MADGLYLWIVGLTAFVLVAFDGYTTFTAPPPTHVEISRDTVVGANPSLAMHNNQVASEPSGVSEIYPVDLHELALKTIDLLPKHPDDDHDSAYKIASIQVTDLAFYFRSRPPEVPVKMFRSQNVSGTRPAILFLHGGGWSLGTLEFYEPVCKWLAAHTGMVVFSIEHYHPIGHTYPMPLDKSITAIRNIFQNASYYSIDTERVAIVGDYMGGLLAAAATLKLRDTGFRHHFKAVILIYPILQTIEFRLPSHFLHAHEGVCLVGICHFWMYYGFSEDWDIFTRWKVEASNHTSPAIKQKYSTYYNPKDLPPEYIPADYKMPRYDYGDDTLWRKLESVFLDPYFSPGIADDLSNLPPTFIMTVGKDPLRDEAILYAQRLRRQGNDVTHKHYPECFPGVLTQPHFRETANFRREIRDFLIKKL